MENFRYFDMHEVNITHIRGSGPGGQNRNKRWSGVRAEHLPSGIVAEATERRSQSQNLQAALERLDAKLAAKFFKPKPRIPTKTTRAAKQKRLASKSHRSTQKQNRRRSYED